MSMSYFFFFNISQNLDFLILLIYILTIFIGSIQTNKYYVQFFFYGMARLI